MDETGGSKLQKLKEHLKRKSYLRDDEGEEQGPPASLASTTSRPDDEEYVPIRKRKEMLAQSAVQRDVQPTPLVAAVQPVELKRAASPTAPPSTDRPAIPLVAQVAVMRAAAVPPPPPVVVAAPSVNRSWSPPRFMSSVSDEELADIRRRLCVTVTGEGGLSIVPALRFTDLKLPNAISSYLSAEKLTVPTSIQSQALPAMLLGRDVLAIAPPNSGKSLALLLHLTLVALEAESRLPLEPNEGPVGLLIAPSREAAKHTFEELEALTDALRAAGAPRLNAALCVSGTQLPATPAAVHIVVATMGRLIESLRRSQLSLAACEVLAIDEAERVIDFDFKEDLRIIATHFRLAHQTILFSSTPPRAFAGFASAFMVTPVAVHHVRPLHELDVVQEVAWVRNESKQLYLLECLQKTAPPVMIIADARTDAEQVYEFLLRNHVNATLLVGNKEEERDSPVSALRAKRRDVLVTTDGAIKGVSLPDLRHVIAFDMAKDVDSYVQRMCRTGAGRIGLITTLINHSNPKPSLIALRRLMHDTEQRVPGCLEKLAET